jgi:hypothetical protein
MKWKDQGYLLHHISYLPCCCCNLACMSLTMQHDIIEWGNAKGEVWLRLMRGTEEIKVHRQFGVAPRPWGYVHTRLVLPPSSVSPLPNPEEFADEVKQSVTATPLTIQASELVALAHVGDSIEVWRSIGGGGGHQLFVEYLHITAEWIL